MMSGLTEDEWLAIALTLRVALMCVVMTLPIGMLLGWLLARWRFKGKLILEALVHLPLVLPPVVVGYVLLLTMGPNATLGRWLEKVIGQPVAFTWWAAVIASSVMSLPLMVRAIRLAIETVDIKQEQAAQVHGASIWRVWWAITLPAAWPGVVVGMLLAFARSVGEFGATMTFAGNIQGQTRTLSLAIYRSMQMPDGDTQVMRLAWVAVGLSVLAVVLSEFTSRWQQRRLA